MNVIPLHDWNITPAAARRLQTELATRVSQLWQERKITTVAGIDTAFAGDVGCAAITILSYPDLAIIEQATAKAPVPMPYIPGLLSFREVPIIVKALAKLQHEPDVILVDGQGRLHPRRFGIACHVGVILDLPTIGCAKSLLCGAYKPPDLEKGSCSPVHHRGECIGAAVRSRVKVKEILVSVGHRMSLDAAVRLTLSVTTRYRLPEPIRHADRLSRLAKQQPDE